MCRVSDRRPDRTKARGAILSNLHDGGLAVGFIAGLLLPGDDFITGINLGTIIGDVSLGNGSNTLTNEGRTALIEVADNGPGFPDDAEELLERGVRADMKKPGHGIGLAAVYDLVRAYEGQLLLGASDLGGARVIVRLPG